MPKNSKGIEVAEVLSDTCMGCQICVAECPVGAIEMVDGVARIDPEVCIGCGKCKEVCPMKAITGEPGGAHKILLDKCVGCALCYKICDPKVITMAFSLGYVET